MKALKQLASNQKFVWFFIMLVAVIFVADVVDKFMTLPRLDAVHDVLRLLLTVVIVACMDILTRKYTFRKKYFVLYIIVTLVVAGEMASLISDAIVAK